MRIATNHSRPVTYAQADPPSISGLAPTAGGTFLAVHDVKSYSDKPPVTVFDTDHFQFSEVEVDWLDDIRAEDLEGITPLNLEQGRYLAVEGSRYQGRTPQLHLLEFDGDHQAKETARFPLPELPYEVEGVATHSSGPNDTLILLGGRGDGLENAGRVHWGVLNNETQEMTWTDEGLEGVPVRPPLDLGISQRTIGDLVIDERGQLWGSATIDEGDTGPFDSAIYRIGTLGSDPRAPLTLTSDKLFRVPSSKVEALAPCDHGRPGLLIGSDNESFGGVLAQAVLPA